MNSSRPYLLRALYEWIVDNDCTPHLLVASDYPGTRVPAGYAKDGQIVLNISPSAVRHLQMGNDLLSFEGRFGGVAQVLRVPVPAVLALYARENGQGMFFDLDEQDDEEAQAAADAAPSISPDPDDDTPPPRPSGRPSLKVVK
ncbi:ClpXP protease specificity-enhancing factor [Pseudomonas sp. NW5]|uniref:ClpXP protease specificity-enhancing factor n=1 Tax=Pseudomonas sp. NW5 TaxID=2934934 RepID=UPI002021FD33|nr:ClpXP protease specificity-enhancing factor [Pseudomonas sp. NW5]MCL7461511.1 ClpXP protease specificity-enhancing factor [Pseudomonas sp. NW5]